MCAHAAEFERGLGRRDWTFRAQPGDSLIRLPDRLPLLGSDSVWVRGLPAARGIDYRVLGGPARLFWLHLPPDSAEIHIRYRYLAVPLADLYQHPAVWSPGSSGGPTTGAIPTSGLPPRPGDSPGTFGRFNISGSKTLSFEVASQRDLAVKQSLDLSLGGGDRR